MRNTTTTIIATLLLLSAAIGTAQTGNDLLWQAQKKVYEERDFAGAIQIYDRILKEFAADRAMIGRASTERVRAKELLTRADALKGYEQMVRDFADQPAVIEAARRRLAEAALPNPTAGIYIVEFDQSTGVVRGPVERITDWDTAVGFPVWSPDRRLIAVRHGIAGAGLVGGPLPYLGVLSPTGETQMVHKLGRPGEALNRSQWLHDGTALLSFEINGDVYRIDRQGNARRLVQVALNRGNFSGGGYQMAVSSDEKTLYVYGVGSVGGASFASATVVAFDLSTGESKHFFSLPLIATPTNSSGYPVQMLRSIAVSPDGESLALIRRPQGPDVRIAIIGTGGDDYRDVWFGAGPVGHIAWSTDGSYIFFSTRPPGSVNEMQIMKVPAKGGEASFTGLAVTEISGFDLSPDGSRLAFSGRGYRLVKPTSDPEKQQ